MQLAHRAGLVQPSIPLLATNEAGEMLLAGRFLLLLDSNTWTSRHTLDLINDIVNAVRLSQKIDFGKGSLTLSASAVVAEGGEAGREVRVWM